MPSVAMRRSTRICVPKSVGKDGNLGKVLRSGKRLLIESDEEVKKGRGERKHEHFVDEPPCPVYKSNGWCKVIQKRDEDDVDVTDIDSDESVENMNSSDEKRYKNVYDRKRRRSLDDISPSSSQSKEEDRMHGAFYVRKKLRKTDKSGVMNRVGVSSEQEISSNTVDEATLDVMVDFSLGSSLSFTRFFVSVLKFMTTSNIALSGLAAFMCSERIVEIFSRHGVHFKHGFSSRGNFTGGFCRIFGDKDFIPLFWLDFCAAPLSFRNLYSVVYFRSLLRPSCFLSNLLCTTHGDEGENISSLSTEIGLPQSEESENSPKNTKNNFPVEGFGLNGIRVSTRRTQNKRKRSTLRRKRVNKSSSLAFRDIRHFHVYNQTKIEDSGKNDHAYRSIATPAPNVKQSNLIPKCLSDNHKEVKSTVVGLRQNVDSSCCKGNVLVIESDRCYREEGATVTLECSTSKVWHVVVNAQGVTKYIHQAHEAMRSYTTNRFTHAMIWTAEDGWKLEFCDRQQWVIFKELHKECVSKNLKVNSAKTIPVPGVREVLSYDDGKPALFSRPDTYITVHSNEVARALGKTTANYDIDQEDEEWLKKLNSGLFNTEDGPVEYLSTEKFEEIIDILEKAAYRSPGDVSNESKMTGLCLALGRGDVLSAVYQYWLKKRKQKNAALLLVFECQPPRKTKVMQENVLRKKRSFKKQTSQNVRDKQQFHFQEVCVEQGQLDVKRVREAQRKAQEAFEVAVIKRQRAQTLMENADKLTYMAAMAMNIAESVHWHELNNSHDWFPVSD